LKAMSNLNYFTAPITFVMLQTACQFISIKTIVLLHTIVVHLNISWTDC